MNPAFLNQKPIQLVERMVSAHNQRLRLNQKSIDIKIATNTPHSRGYDHFHLSSGINSKFIP